MVKKSAELVAKSREEVPERMWWCHTCNGGVGIWGVDNDQPPPRCPACHKYNFADVKFIPQENLLSVKKCHDSIVSELQDAADACEKFGCEGSDQ